MTTVMSGMARRSLPTVVPAFVWWVMLAGAASAQTLTTGAVIVNVVDATGQPVAEVLLSLEDSAAGISRSAAADRDGGYRFGALQPGTYSLTAEAIGFAPRRMTDIDVRPERAVSVLIELSRAEGAVALVEQRFTGGASVAPGAGQWVARSALRSLPGPRRELDEAVRFTSPADERFSAEGLPPRLSALAIDGIAFRSASHPSDADTPIRSVAFTLSGFDAAQLITNPVDVEWSSVAASVLSAYSRHGGMSRAGDAFASWSGDALSASSLEGGDVSWSDLQGGITVRGALGEASRFSMGATARRTEMPASPAWPDTDAAARLMDADAAAMGFDAYRSAAAVPEDAIAAFANVDWSLSERHTIRAGVHVAALPEYGVIDRHSGAITQMEGADLLTDLSLLSGVGRAARNELRVGLTSSERTGVADDSDVPFTRIVGDALAFGSSPAIESARDAQLRISEAIHFRSGAHALKLGGVVSLGAYRYLPVENRLGEYLYGDVDQFIAGNGVFARTEGDAPLAEWTDRTFALFVQDRYAIAPGLDLTAGIRVERQTLPSDVRRDTVWAALTGITNDDVEEPELRLSPRASLSWDPAGSGRWMLHAAGGIYYDRMDPLLLATWQSDDGTSGVRRAAGALEWPPAGTQDGVLSSRLTVLSDGFEAPRTIRGTAGLVSRIATGTTLHITGVVRRTQNLPRRTDLNLAPLPAARDQHGREVYGILIQQGGLLAAVPTTNRRFTTYDEVAAITADGVSDHWGVTAGIEYEMDVLNVLARYTFGRTTDDWFGAATGGWTQVLPVGIGEAWVDGTSDFDVPHRAVLGAIATGPIGLRLGAAYRVQSGRPFTPGFRPGVDANADGNATNDPAFVDESIAGITDLIGSHSCLTAGAFAERNSCRTDIVHALDVSLALPLFRSGGASASIMLDAFDVLESANDIPDAALYLVDPAGSIITDPVAGTVTLPLIANPDFGEPLTRRMPGRRIRLGLSFNW